MYNDVMVYVDFITSAFWATMEGLVPLIVPIIAIILIFRIIGSFIVGKDRP